jgi:membrane protein DedA with SNARE-associated domain
MSQAARHHVRVHHLQVVALHLHHHVRGPKGDYIGLGAAAFASWAGIPGPGEAALVASGILAAHHHLDIAAAVAVAWLGATLGGTAGWLAGLKAGRTVLSRPGPLYRMRMSALERGDRFFERYGAVAVFFSPAWIAGIHGMSAARFLPANALAALTWALAFGLGAYVIGPSILDLVTDLGFVSALVVGALIVAAVVGALRVRRRRRSA